MAWNLGEIHSKLTLDVSGFNANIQSATTALSSFGDNDGISGKLIELGSNIKNIGKNLETTLAPIADFAKSSVEAAMSFELAMARVQSVSNATEEELEALTNVAREMGRDTVYSATEAAEALYYMGLAGWDANASIDALEPVLKLAAASQEDLGTVSDIVTDAMTAFGLEANEAAHFADVLAQASTNSNTTVALLGESFRFVAPVAGEFGFSIEDTALALGIFANQGIKGSQAGTTLRNILARLVAPTDAVAQVMADLGIEIFNTDGSMKSLKEIIYVLRDGFNDLSEEQLANIYITEDVIQALDDLGISLYDANGEMKDLVEIAELADIALEGLNDETRENYLATLGGIRGLTGLASILNVTDEELEQLISELENADGALDTMYETIANTTWGAWKEFESALESVKITIGDVLLPVITDLLGKFADIIRWLDSLDPAILTAIAGFVGLVAVIGPIVSFIGTVITIGGTLVGIISAIAGAVSFLAGGLATLGGTILALLGPVGVIIAAIGALATAFVYAYNHSEWFRDKVNAAIAAVKKAFSDFGKKVQEIWETIKDFFSDIGKKIGKFVSNVVDKFNEIKDNVIETVSNWVETAKSAISDFVDSVVSGFKNMVDSVVEFFTKTIPSAVGGFVETVIGAISDFAESVWNFFTVEIPEHVKSFIRYLNEDFAREVGEALGAALAHVANFALDIWDFFTKTIPSYIDKLIGWFKKLPGQIWDAISGAISYVYEWGSGLWETFSEWISKIIDDVVTWFSELPGKIWDAIVSIWDLVAEWASGIWDIVSEWITKTINDVVTWLSELPGKIWNAIKSAFNYIADWGSGIYNRAKDWITKTIDNVVSWMSKLPGKIWDAIKGAIDNVAKWGSDLYEKGKKAAKDLFDVVTTEIGKIPGKVVSIGADIVRGLWNGISSLTGWIGDQVKSFCGGVVSGFKKFFKINSPSKLVDREVGQWVGRGFGVGIIKSLPEVLDDVEEFSGDVLDALEDELTAGVDIDLINSLQDSLDYQPTFIDGLTEAFSGFIDMLTDLSDEFALFMQPEQAYSLAYGQMPTQGFMESQRSSVMNVTFENVNIRDDSDITKISQELESINSRAARANGVRGFD